MEGEHFHTFLSPPVALLSPRTAGTRGPSPPLEADAASSSFSDGCASFSDFSCAESSTSPFAALGAFSTGLFLPPSARLALDGFLPPRPPRPLPRPRPRPLSPPRERGRVGVEAGGPSSSGTVTTGSSCGCGTSDCVWSSVETGMISSSNRSSPPRVCANSSITGASVARSAIGAVGGDQSRNKCVAVKTWLWSRI